LVRDALEPEARPLHEQDLEAVVLLEVHVLRRNDFLQILVLNLHQPALQTAARVVVDERDRAGHDLPPELLLVLHELLADHLRDGLGAAAITTRRDHRIEIVAERTRERNGDAAGGGFFAWTGHGAARAKAASMRAVRRPEEYYDFSFSSYFSTSACG